MLRSILWIVAVVALCVGGWYLYQQITGHSLLGSGDVISRSSPSSSTDTQDNASNTDIDGKPADPNATTTFDKNAPPPGSATNQPPAVAGSGTVVTGPTPMPQDGGGMVAPPVPTTTAPVASAPVTDTQTPNAPNGMAFGGSGKFQWYRQGNITYRVDTTSGSTCVAFATNDEWRNPHVLSHGCGSSS